MRLVSSVLLIAVAAVLLAAPMNAHADDATPAASPVAVALSEPPKLSIRPAGATGGYITVAIEPGMEQAIAVDLGNFGQEPVKTRTYAADVYTLINGGFGVKLDGEPVSSVTTWLDYPTQTRVMAAQEALRITFTVAVPKETAPGQYITALVIQPADPIKGTGGIAFDQVVRQAMAIVIDVPGERHAGLTTGDVAYLPVGAGANLRVAVTNTGNKLLKPSGALTLTDAAGTVLRQVAIAMDSFYAGTTTAIEIGLSPALAPGTYAARLTLSAEGVSVDSGELPFTVAAPATPVATATPVIAIAGVDVAELRDGATLQAVDVTVRIDNPGPPIDGGRVTLRVTRDGKAAEDVVLGDALSFPGGPAELRQRYQPLDGWQPGIYRFTAILERVDPATGEIIPLATLDATSVVTAP